jgi:hypothetical protein
VEEAPQVDAVGLLEVCQQLVGVLLLGQGEEG